MSRLKWNCLFGALSVVMIFSLGQCHAAEPKDQTSADPDLQKVVSLQKILDNIPKDSQPRADVDGAIELIKANEWLARNLVGKPIEFKAHLSDATVIGGGEGRYTVQLKFAHARSSDLLYVGSVRSGRVDWKVNIFKLKSWQPVLDEAAVRLVQELRGKDVTITGIVSNQPWPYSGDLAPPYFVAWRTKEGKVLPELRLQLSDVKMEGYPLIPTPKTTKKSPKHRTTHNKVTR